MLNREDFKKYIDELTKYSDFCSEMYDIVGEKILDRMCHAETIIIQMLERFMGDEKTNWIAYWVYDLERGTKYVEGCVTFNDVNVPLKSVDDLYNILYDNYTRESTGECENCTCGGKL